MLSIHYRTVTRFYCLPQTTDAAPSGSQAEDPARIGLQKSNPGVRPNFSRYFWSMVFKCDSELFALSSTEATIATISEESLSDGRLVSDAH
jgi:hypothetical protein